MAWVRGCKQGALRTAPPRLARTAAPLRSAGRSMRSEHTVTYVTRACSASWRCACLPAPVPHAPHTVLTRPLPWPLAPKCPKAHTSSRFGRAAVAAYGQRGSAERNWAPDETGCRLGSRGIKCWLLLERGACARARRRPGRRFPCRVLGAELARRCGSSFAVHAHIGLAGSAVEAGSRQPRGRSGKWQGGQQRQCALLVRSPICRQLGVTLIMQYYYVCEPRSTSQRGAHGGGRAGWGGG